MFVHRQRRIVGTAVLLLACLASGCANNKDLDPPAKRVIGPPEEQASGLTVRRTHNYAVRTGPAGPRTTGVPVGTTLRVHRGDLIISKRGLVVDSMDIQGRVQIEADDVVIQRSRITSSAIHPVTNSGRNLTLRDSEIAGERPCHTGILSANYRLIRVNIHGCGDGLQARSNVTVEDSYIHDLAISPGEHNDGIQSIGGEGIVIMRNRIVWKRRQTSAILLKADVAPIRNVLIEGNYLDGGSYVLYARHGSRFKISDVTVTGNRFGRSFLYGPVSTDIALLWRKNRWADTRRFLPRPAPEIATLVPP